MICRRGELSLTRSGPTHLSSFGNRTRHGQTLEKLSLCHDSCHFKRFSLGKVIDSHVRRPGQKEAKTTDGAIPFRRGYSNRNDRAQEGGPRSVGRECSSAHGDKPDPGWRGAVACGVDIDRHIETVIIFRSESASVAPTERTKARRRTSSGGIDLRARKEANTASRTILLNTEGRSDHR